MEEFLIDLALNATWDRLLPFPDEFRVNTKPPQDHSKEDHKNFIDALNKREQKALSYVLDIDRGIVQHNKKSIHPLVTEYEFQYDAIDNYRKNLKYPKRWYLFHGSPLGNWHSILRNGIKNMSGTRFMSSGQAHGAGVYASNDLHLAYGYGGNAGGKCVAVIELLVDPSQFKKTDGIYVIPDDKLLFPRYLLRMSGLPKSDGKEILDYYKKLRDGLIKSKTKPNRLEKDRRQLDAYFIETLSDHCWSIVVDGTLMRCYVYNYPFTVPVLQLVYKVDNEYFDKLGCYNYPFLDWSAQDDILKVIEHAKSNVDFEKLSTQSTTEEYTKLEDSL
jgi:hypothetical protein